MKGIDIVEEINRVLQEEIDKLWEQSPIGYNKDNDGYHMGKGIIVNKSTWDKYQKALKQNPNLEPFQFMVDLFKNMYNDK